MKKIVLKNIEYEIKNCPICDNAPYDENDFIHPSRINTHNDVKNLPKEELDFLNKKIETNGSEIYVLCCLTHEGGCGLEISGNSYEEIIERWNNAKRREKC